MGRAGGTLPRTGITSKIATRDNLPSLKAALKKLETRQLAVGFPEDKNAPRKEEGADVTNALIAYSLTKGNQAQNLPPRPFLTEGVREGSESITDQLKNAGQNAIEGNHTGVEKGLVAAGVVAVSAVRKKMVDGPFAALAAATLRKRRTRKIAPTDRTEPLRDTGQLIAAVNFTVRDYKEND